MHLKTPPRRGHLPYTYPNLFELFTKKSHWLTGSSVRWQLFRIRPARCLFSLRYSKVLQPWDAVCYPWFYPVPNTGSAKSQPKIVILWLWRSGLKQNGTRTQIGLHRITNGHCNHSIIQNTFAVQEKNYDPPQSLAITGDSLVLSIGLGQRFRKVRAPVPVLSIVGGIGVRWFRTQVLKCRRVF